jgi:hypothetical protein
MLFILRSIVLLSSSIAASGLVGLFAIARGASLLPTTGAKRLFPEQTRSMMVG